MDKKSGEVIGVAAGFPTTVNPIIQFGSQLLGFLLGVVIVRVSGLDVTGNHYSLLAITQICAGVVGTGIKTNFYRSG